MYGLQILDRYIKDHALKPYQVDSLAFGVSFFFILAELIELFIVLKEHGLESARGFESLDPFARNMLLLPEHPSPLSRVPAAVDMAVIDPDFAMCLVDNYGRMLLPATIAFGMMLYNADEILSQATITPMLQVDGLSLFSGLNAMGQHRPRSLDQI